MKAEKIYIPQSSEQILELISKKDITRTGALESGAIASLSSWNNKGDLFDLFRNKFDAVSRLNAFQIEMLGNYIDGVLGKPQRIGDPDINYGAVYMRKGNNGKIPYECIPLSTYLFIEMAIEVRKLFKDKDIKFVDAGCGVGDKLYLASMVLNPKKFKGLELSKYIINYGSYKYRGRGLMVNGENPFILGDITTFNFKPFNLIYAYNPINGERGMYEFFLNVLNTAEVGTICWFENVHTGWGAMNRINEEVHLKKFKHLQARSAHLWKVVES